MPSFLLLSQIHLSSQSSSATPHFSSRLRSRLTNYVAWISLLSVFVSGGNFYVFSCLFRGWSKHTFHLYCLIYFPSERRSGRDDDEKYFCVPKLQHFASAAAFQLRMCCRALIWRPNENEKLFAHLNPQERDYVCEKAAMRYHSRPISRKTNPPKVRSEEGTHQVNRQNACKWELN